MSNRIDETGNKYGEWTILEYIPPEKREKPKSNLNYLAQCSCGNIRPVRSSDLKNGKSKSCGCLKNKKWDIEIGKVYGEVTVLYQLKNRHGNYIQKYHCKCSCGNEVDWPADYINKKKNCGCRYMKGFDTVQDMIGEKYGHLTVLEMSNRLDKKGKRSYRICQCDCGNIIEVYRGHLKDGHTQSCGCIVSFGENYVYDYLKQCNLNVVRQYKTDLIDKAPLPFDIAILNKANSLLALIEIQGKQHYDSSLFFYSDYIIKHDTMKKEYCINKNIPFLILDYSLGKEKTNFEKWNQIINNFLKENHVYEL